MRQPPGFECFGPRGQCLVAHLLSSLYGLKQAAYDWYELLRAVLISLGFIRCDADYAVFIFDHVNAKGVRIVCIIAWHVDDGLAGANNCAFLDQTKSKIVERFGIMDLGPISKYLSIQFTRNHQTHELWMHQEEYIAYLLQEHRMSHCPWTQIFHLDAQPTCTHILMTLNLSTARSSVNCSTSPCTLGWILLMQSCALPRTMCRPNLATIQRCDAQTWLGSRITP
jgi:hypothetical protein